ncbi:MAG: cupin domain-containing protein [Prevotella sp.]|nr:cupin domain-containing protein [Prevotella sp.]MBQ5605852.1 cupin domain-containing protein [Prevotella sp.]MEE1092963.1 cupin domain-containing protein [Prevotella sp.]
MVIDFNEIEEVAMMNFKGGIGELDTRNYVEEGCRIMLSRLQPGASSGEHTHVGDGEIVYVIKGEATFCYDGVNEVVYAGQVHYCPDGHTHYMKNETEDEVLYLAIVK